MSENKKIELEENEIMRLSVRKIDSEKGDYRSSFASNGPSEPMVQALMQACEGFGLVCLPKKHVKTIRKIIATYMSGGNPFAEPEEGEGTEEGTGNNEE